MAGLAGASAKPPSGSEARLALPRLVPEGRESWVNDEAGGNQLPHSGSASRPGRPSHVVAGAPEARLPSWWWLAPRPSLEWCTEKTLRRLRGT